MRELTQGRDGALDARGERMCGADTHTAAEALARREDRPGRDRDAAVERAHLQLDGRLVVALQLDPHDEAALRS